MREKVRVGWSERIALKRVYSVQFSSVQFSSVASDSLRPHDQGNFKAWSRAHKANALVQPRRMGGGGWWEGIQDGGTHEHLWLIHVDVSQKPPQHCKAISLQLNKLIQVKKKKGLFSLAESNHENIFQITLKMGHFSKENQESLRFLSTRVR